MNDIALSVTLATAPSSAFAELRERPRFWFPLLLLTLTSAAILCWYYSVVDIEWLKNAMLTENPDIQKMPEEQRAAATGMMTRTTMLWGSVIGALIAMPLIFVVSALYLWLAAKLTKLPAELRFKHWFTFSAWTSMPLLLNVVIGAIFLLLADNAQISPSTLQPLSLNELVLHRPMFSPGHALLESLTIPSFLSWALMIVGVRVWGQRSWTFSTLLILLPSLVIYGIWAFFAFR